MFILIKLCVDSLWVAPWHSGGFTQPRKMKAIKVPTLFDIKSFACQGHPRETTLTFKNQRIDMSSDSSDYSGFFYTSILYFKT